MLRFPLNLFRRRPVRRHPHRSFLRDGLPTAEDIAEESRSRVCHQAKDGSMMYFLLSGKNSSVEDLAHIERKPLEFE